MQKNGFAHYTLFGLPVRFAVNEAALNDAYQRVQGLVHPDRFAAGTAAERRVAAQWAARANEALTVLRSPLRRAIYLCEQNGVVIGAESNTAMQPAFLMQQMTWREELDEARHAPDRLSMLVDQVARERKDLIGRLGQAIDTDADFAGAAELARQLMFVERFSEELHELSGRPHPETRSAAEN
jgi:molecular chaperone HscB